MANLKEIRTRIKSVQSTQQITSAMKMVSAAKLRRAQDAITRMRPYATKLQDILENLSSTLDTSENLYAKEGTSEQTLIVAISSNRGLAGAFNANVVKAVNAYIAQNAQEDVKVLTLGKKVFDVFKKTDRVENEGYDSDTHSVYENLHFEFVSGVAEEVMNHFTSGSYGKVFLVYNSFKNAATQILKTEAFLPIQAPDGSDSRSQGEYIFEPSKEAIVEDLIPKSLKIQFYKALLDSYASEHAARMTAMHKATDNAGELLKELRLFYNKARQAAITGEILEIVAGAEALD